MLRAFLEDEALKIERTFLRELSIKNQEVMIHLRKLKLAEQEKARLKVEVDFLKSRNQILDSKVLQLNVEQMISKEFDKFNNCKCSPKMEKGDQHENEKYISAKVNISQDKQSKQTSEIQQNKQISENQPNKQMSENQPNKQTSENQQNKQTKPVEDAQNSRKPKDKKSATEKKRTTNSISNKKADDKIKTMQNASKKKSLLQRKAQKKNKLQALNKSKKIKTSSVAKDDIDGQIININILKKEQCKNVIAKESKGLDDKKKDKLKKKKNYNKILESGKSVYLCKKCDFKASTLYHMNKHMASEHLCFVWFSCDECGHQTKSKQNIALHKTRKHKVHQATSSQG